MPLELFIFVCCHVYCMLCVYYNQIHRQANSIRKCLCRTLISNVLASCIPIRPSPSSFVVRRSSFTVRKQKNTINQWNMDNGQGLKKCHINLFQCDYGKGGMHVLGVNVRNENAGKQNEWTEQNKIFYTETETTMTTTMTI